MQQLPAWRSRDLLAALAICLAALLIFFRFQIANGFTVFAGDRYDAMIEVAILQHWSNVFQGAEPWDMMAYFYPAADSLGYNDAYFFHGVLFTVGRSFGLPLVAAAEAAHLTMKVIGFVGMERLLSTGARCRRGWALFGAALFTIADVTLQHANHGQLFTLGFAPWAFLLAWKSCQALLARDARGVLKYGLPLGLVYALWVSTAFYLAWFFALCALVYLVTLFVLTNGEQRTAAAGALKATWPQLAFIAVVTAIALLPFLLVYLPKQAETGMHAYSVAHHSLLHPLDYLNTSPTNLLWGEPFNLIRRLLNHNLRSNPDDIFGISPLLFGLALWVILRRSRSQPIGLKALGFATLVCWLLMLKIGPVSAWRLVYALVPGGAGIRVVGRFNLLLLVPVITIVIVALDRSGRPWRGVVVAGMLLAEQANTTAPIHLDQAERLAMLAHIPALPTDCESFYVVSSRLLPYPEQDPENDHLYAHNVDAMVIAETKQARTVNGFSTFNPPFWNFDYPGGSDYRRRVTSYAAKTEIRMPCRLDVSSGTFWTVERAGTTHYPGN